MQFRKKKQRNIANYADSNDLGNFLGIFSAQFRPYPSNKPLPTIKKSEEYYGKRTHEEQTKQKPLNEESTQKIYTQKKFKKAQLMNKRNDTFILSTSMT